MVTTTSVKRWSWIGLTLTVVVVAAMACVNYDNQSSDPNQRTVDEAVNGLAQQDPKDIEAKPSQQPGFRLVELVSALGLPASSIPTNVYSATGGTPQERQALKETLQKVVGSGQMTPQEANAVLKAFDQGIVSAPIGPMVADSKNPASKASAGG